MTEGKVYKVELLTGKMVTVPETVSGRVVVLGGTTYRIGKKDLNGVRKLRPLKSTIAKVLETEVCDAPPARA